MEKNKDKWSALSMKERADLIKLYVSNGITSLNDIKKNYNSFGDGGDKSKIITAEITPSQAIKYNESADNAAFMIPFGGTPDRPEYLYPAELEPSVVIDSAKEAEQKDLEKKIAELMSSDAWKTIPLRQGENFEANKHARKYVEPVVNSAVTGIGGSMLMANPLATTLGTDLIGNLGHATHVMMNPLAAKTTAGAFLSTATDSYLTVNGLQRNEDLINNWRNGNFNWADLPEFALNFLSVLPYTKAADSAMDFAKTTRVGNPRTKTTTPITKGDPGLAQDYINAPGNAEPIYTKNADIINKQQLGKLSSHNPSKLTEAEIQGLPKHDRTNVVHDPLRYGVKDSPQELLNSKGFIHNNDKFKERIDDVNRKITNDGALELDYFQHKNAFKDPYFAVTTGYGEEDFPEDLKAMRDFARSLDIPDDKIHNYFKSFSSPQTGEVESFYVKLFRDYLGSRGYDRYALSTKDIQKILTYNEAELSKGITGKLKGIPLWHTTSGIFDEFDFINHLGKNTNNFGVYGPGNYFSSHLPVPYGIGLRNKLIYPQPYYITDISEVIPQDVALSKGLVSKPYNPNFKYPQNNKTIITGHNTGAHPMTYNQADEGITVMEVAIPRNTGIKSFYPAPDRFRFKDDGTVEFIPTDWNDPRFNYKYGGKLLTKRK